MILIDYSQVSLANILSFKKELMSGDAKATTDLIRHATLSTIKSYKKKYGKDYGDIVICCDGRNYWRRQYFEYYKSGRKKAREASDLDWHMIFDTLGVIRDEMKEHFPYKILHIDQCEADDIRFPDRIAFCDLRIDGFQRFIHQQSRELKWIMYANTAIAQTTIVAVEDFLVWRVM